MTRTSALKAVPPASNDRKQQVRNRLAGLGVRRRLPGSSTDDNRARGRMLAAALEELGPVFASFGLYMSSRIDLLAGATCEELARIADRGQAAPRGYVSDLIQRELGSAPADLFALFDEVPFASCLISQSHRARLEDGPVIEIRLVRPEVHDCSHDLQLLPLAVDAFGGAAALNAAIDDFRETYLRRLDMDQQARSLSSMALGTEDVGELRVPLVYREFCGPNVLTIEHVPGTPLDEFLRGSGSHVDPRHTVRLLCQVWLRQALMGEAFPADLQPGEVTILSARQVALSGGSIHMPPAESREHLWKYLIAISAEDADGACTALLAQTLPSTRPADEHKLRQRFRQIVPFREGTWGTGGNDLAGHIFVQWREATEQGCTLEPHLVAFFRGLFAVAETAHRFSPGYDVLSDALRDVRLTSGIAQFRKIMDQGYMGEQMASMASLLLTMPRRMDSFLSAGAGDVPVKIQLQEGSGSRRRNNASAAVASLAILMAALALFAHRFLPGFLGPQVADQAVTVLFVVLGAVLLRAVSRI